MNQDRYEELENLIIGLTREEANYLLDGYESIRPLKIDGVDMICTMDLNFSRINVTIENEKIINIIDRG